MLVRLISHNRSDDSPNHMGQIGNIILKEYTLIHLLPKEYYRNKNECQRYLPVFETGEPLAPHRATLGKRM